MRRRGDGRRGSRRGDVRDRAAAADADAKAVALDLDFGQAGFVEQLGELADQLLVDGGLVFGHVSWAPCSALALLGRHRGEAVDRERIALDAEAADHGLGGKRNIGMVAPGLARMDVADVALDRRHADALDGVMARDRSVGQAARIEHDAGRLLGAGLLDPIDDHALVVGLAKLDAEAVRVGGLAAELLDVLERRMAIDVRLAGAEQIEVRAVEHVDRFGVDWPWARLRVLLALINPPPRQGVVRFIGTRPAKGKPALTRAALMPSTLAFSAAPMCCFSISAANSAAEPGTTSWPVAWSRSTITGSASAARTSVAIFSRSSLGMSRVP